MRLKIEVSRWYRPERANVQGEAAAPARSERRRAAAIAGWKARAARTVVATAEAAKWRRKAREIKPLYLRAQMLPVENDVR